jgi:hypothetical protein
LTPALLLKVLQTNCSCMPLNHVNYFHIFRWQVTI